MAERTIPTREALASLLAALHYGQYSTNEDERNLRKNIERALRDFDIGRAVFVTDGVSVRCPACNGNDAEMPCAYPEGGQRGCLRDKRLGRTDGVALRDGGRQE